MAHEKLTDKVFTATLEDNDVSHTVDKSDLTSSPEGTSKQTRWSLIKSTLKSYFDTIYTANVIANANIGNNLLVRGDGAGEGVQNSGINISDTDDITGVTSLLLDDVTYAGLSTGLAFGDGDTGFYEEIDDVIRISIGGTAYYHISAAYFGFPNKANMMNQQATATLPVFVPEGTDTNTGIGWAAADQLSLIAGGVEGIRVNTATTGVNYLDITPSATTNAVQIATEGIDTNIDLALMPKGSGKVNIGTTSLLERLNVDGNIIADQYKLSALNTAPSSATDTGILGEIRYTASFLYVCTATDTWVRAALSTW